MKKTRWQQRLENFGLVFTLLQSAFAEKSLSQFSEFI